MSLHLISKIYSITQTNYFLLLIHCSTGSRFLSTFASSQTLISHKSKYANHEKPGAVCHLQFSHYKQGCPKPVCHVFLSRSRWSIPFRTLFLHRLHKAATWSIHQANLFGLVPRPSCAARKPTGGWDVSGKEQAASCQSSLAHSQPLCMGEQDEFLFAYYKKLWNLCPSASKWASTRKKPRQMYARMLWLGYLAVPPMEESVSGHL